MICKACNEEFLPQLENEDLCPECMDAIREGGQEIVLGKYDCAIVLRSENGETWSKEIFISHQDDPEAPVSNAVYTTVLLAMGMDSHEVWEACQRKFDEVDTMVKENESVERAAAEDEALEESPDSTEQGSS